MQEISELQATTPTGLENLPHLTHYVVLKMMHNGDYLVRDQLADNYLLTHTTNHHPVALEPPHVSGTHLLCPQQTIHEQSHSFQVFPMDVRLTWAGDARLSIKPQLYCLSLLYSAVRHIVKPLISSSLLHPENYIIEDNLWFKDNACYLFLCSRSRNNRQLLRTEQFGRKPVGRSSKGGPSRQDLMLGKLGELFWKLWSRQDMPNKQRASVFGEILKGMIKGEINLEYFEKIMQSKMTKKKFIAQLDKRKSIVHPVQSNLNMRIPQQAETIDYSTLYSKLDNLPLTIEKPQRALIHYKRSLNPQSLAFDSPLKLANIIDSQEENYPPSFAKIRKHKRLSLFSQSRQSSSRRQRYGSLSRDLNSVLGARTVSTGQRYCDTIDSEIYYKSISSKAAMKRLKRKQLNQFFMSGKYEKRASSSKKDTLEQKSREKAINLFKKSIERESLGEQSPIDDTLLKAQLKAKRTSLKHTLGKVLFKAAEAIAIGRYPDLSAAVNLRQASSMQKEQQGRAPGWTLEPRHRMASEIKVFNQNMQKEQGKEVYPTKELVQEEYFTLSPSRRMKETDDLSFSKETLINIPLEDNLSASVKQMQQKVDSKQKYPNINSAEKVAKQTNPQPQTAKASDVSAPVPPLNIESNKLESLVSKGNLKQQSEKQALNERQSTQSEHINNQNKEIPLQIQVNQGFIKNDSTKQQEHRAAPQSIKPNSPKKDFYFDQGISQAIEMKQVEDSRYVATSKTKKEKPQKQQEDKKILSKSKAPTKSEKALKNSFKQHQQVDDEIEQVLLLPNEMTSKIQANKKPVPVQLPPTQPKKEESVSKPELPSQPPKSKQAGEEQPTIAQGRSEKNIERAAEVREKKDREKSQEKKSGQRLKTGQSNASSSGGKTVRKQIDQYVYMVNKMGEAVAKSSKLIKKLEGVQWYVGVYFLYKRFFHQRTQIEKYLLEDKPYLTRYEPFTRQEWLEWLAKGEKEALLKKYQDDNRNISTSLAKMAKKVEVLPLPASVMMNVGIHKNIQDSSLVAVDYIIAEYDQLVEMNLIRDPEVFVHICQMINALLVMAELDGKIKQKRPVVEYANIKRSQEELKDLVKKIEDLYEED